MSDHWRTAGQLHLAHSFAAILCGKGKESQVKIPETWTTVATARALLILAVSYWNQLIGWAHRKKILSHGDNIIIKIQENLKTMKIRKWIAFYQNFPNISFECFFVLWIRFQLTHDLIFCIYIVKFLFLKFEHFFSIVMNNLCASVYWIWFQEVLIFCWAHVQIFYNVQRLTVIQLYWFLFSNNWRLCVTGIVSYL